ncbi:unnamed protein product [Amoebophrya sp. A25]|nr:unnamed protein product [Amoebophrya sp. A25]|eukprot:GSA25T00016716001.1
MVAILIMAICTGLLRDLVWAAQCRLRSGVDVAGGVAVSPTAYRQYRERVILQATAKMGASLLFCFFTMAERAGCIGLSYEVPLKCVPLALSNAIVVMSVSLFNVLVFALGGSGLMPQPYAVLTLSSKYLSRAERAAAALLVFIVFLNLFVFATRGVLQYHEPDEKTGKLRLKKEAFQYVLFPFALSWLGAIGCLRFSRKARKLVRGDLLVSAGA